MNDTALAITYISIIAVIGAVVAVVIVTRSRVAQARANAEQVRRYQELADRCVAGQRQTAEELTRLTERIAAIEKLLREVGG
jgi:hypothetical protein